MNSDIKRKTIENDESYLRQVSKEVDFEKDNIEEMIAKLKEYCKEHYCYALAPVQIGITKRIIYIKNTSQNMENNVINGYDEGIVYINPIITYARGITTFLEGCESCIYHQDGKIIHYTAVIKRPYEVEILYYDLQGNKKLKIIKDFEATVFCHEYDHLNGILHIDKSDKIFDMTIDEIKNYRTKHPYNIVSKTGKYKQEINAKDNFENS